MTQRPNEEEGRTEKGKTWRTNCFCLHLKTWCANELLKENKKWSHACQFPRLPLTLRSFFFPCIHPSFSSPPLLLTVSDPTPWASWDKLTEWMSRRGSGGGGNVLVYAVFTVCAKIQTNSSGPLAGCQLQRKLLPFFFQSLWENQEIQPVRLHNNSIVTS